VALEVESLDDSLPHRLPLGSFVDRGGVRVNGIAAMRALYCFF
jgi:hypothetical protein